MYTLVSATLRKKGKNEPYRSLNIATVTLVNLFNQYDDGHIEVTNPNLSPDALYVDLRALRGANVPFYNQGFELWLQAIGNRVLPFLSEEPVYTSKPVVYRDAHQAGYRVMAVDPEAPAPNPYSCHPEAVSVDKSKQVDLFVTKPNVSHGDLYDYVLCSVNGFLHRKVKADTGILIKDGGITARRQPVSQMGLISFKGVGKVEEYGFNPDWLHPIKEGGDWRDGVVVETGMDLTGKSVLISVAGYLHHADAAYDVLSLANGTVKLNIGRIEWIRRLLDMQNYIDISLLGLTRSQRARKAFSVQETRTNEFYYKLLTLSQSFLIVVDNPRVITERIALGQTGINGLLESPREPASPLLHHTGRFQEYWAIKDADKWMVKTDGSAYMEYLFETSPWLTNQAVNDTPSPFAGELSTVHLLSIRSSLRDNA